VTASNFLTSGSTATEQEAPEGSIANNTAAADRLSHVDSQQHPIEELLPIYQAPLARFWKI
jgi:hypothetical protein